MHYQLILQNQVDDLDKSSWTLTPPSVVGRDSSCHVCIEHASISRQHCQFSLNGEGTLVVKDLESMNGIYVDDARVKHAALMPGQVVQVGALRLRVEFTTGVDPMPRAVSKPNKNVIATQPMKTVRPEPKPKPRVPLEKPWWRRLFD
ncbi:MAG TPA: FHA domain-containing protein [Pirellula sp.]|nr:FHA domain-containing protein [Pirellula sp.]